MGSTLRPGGGGTGDWALMPFIALKKSVHKLKKIYFPVFEVPKVRLFN